MPKFFDDSLYDPFVPEEEIRRSEPEAPDAEGPVQAEERPKEEPDLAAGLPPECAKEKGVFAQVGKVGVYGITMRGTSHVANGSCCQDYHSFKYLPEENLWVLVIADGVGSCALSHWGAYTAVNKTIECVASGLIAIGGGEKLSLKNVPQEKTDAIFRDAFDRARVAVEDFADAHQRSVVEFQSTLTAAIYDGETLDFCHIGDDGIVAEGVSGKYLMVTQRVKGEEANSVFTLQSGLWSTGRVGNVAALVMSTDGVLDSYVRSAFENNRVYYPFFERLVYGMQVSPEEAPEKAAEKGCRAAVEFLPQWAEHGSVRDDMTVLVAANLSQLDRPTKPVFDKEEWNKTTDALREKQRSALYSGRQELKKPTPTAQKPAVPRQEDSPAKPAAQPSGRRAQQEFPPSSPSNWKRGDKLSRDRRQENASGEERRQTVPVSPKKKNGGTYLPQNREPKPEKQDIYDPYSSLFDFKGFSIGIPDFGLKQDRCPFCHKKCKRDDRFCSFCGGRLDDFWSL